MCECERTRISWAWWVGELALNILATPSKMRHRIETRAVHVAVVEGFAGLPDVLVLGQKLLNFFMDCLLKLVGRMPQSVEVNSEESQQQFIISHKSLQQTPYKPVVPADIQRKQAATVFPISTAQQTYTSFDQTISIMSVMHY